MSALLEDQSIDCSRRERGEDIVCFCFFRDWKLWKNISFSEEFEDEAEQNAQGIGIYRRREKEGFTSQSVIVFFGSVQRFLFSVVEIMEREGSSHFRDEPVGVHTEEVS